MADSEYNPKNDNTYVSDSYDQGQQANEAVPVVPDSDYVESGVKAGSEDSDEQLARDDKDAIDESNIIDSRTRGAEPTGTYREPGDDEGLPGPEDGTSSV